MHDHTGRGRRCVTLGGDLAEERHRLSSYHAGENLVPAGGETLPG